MSSSKWISSRSESSPRDTSVTTIEDAPDNILHEQCTVQNTCDAITFFQIELKRLNKSNYMHTRAPSQNTLEHWLSYVLPRPLNNDLRAHQHILFKKEFRKATNNDRRHRMLKASTKTPLQILHKCLRTRCYKTFHKLLMHFVIDECYGKDDPMCVGITKHTLYDHRNYTEYDPEDDKDGASAHQHSHLVYIMIKYILSTLCNMVTCMLHEQIIATK